jgi:hypothetical protein
MKHLKSKKEFIYSGKEVNLLDTFKTPNGIKSAAKFSFFKKGDVIL